MYFFKAKTKSKSHAQLGQNGFQATNNLSDVNLATIRAFAVLIFSINGCTQPDPP
jgi:hypothetical protein